MTGPPPGGAPARALAERVVRVATRVEVGVASVAVVVIFVLVLVQAGQRYLPVSGWTWTGELARFCLVWLTFTAAGVLVTRDGHISLQLVDTVRSPTVRRVVRSLSCAVVAVVGLAFAVESLNLVRDEMILDSPALQMPMGLLYVLPLVGFLSTAVRAGVAAGLFAVRGVPDDSSMAAAPPAADDGEGRSPA